MEKSQKAQTVPLLAYSKRTNAITILDYCLISLVTSLYKIIAKVLSNRIGEILYEVIDGNQFAFIKQRYILNSI